MAKIELAMIPMAADVQKSMAGFYYLACEDDEDDSNYIPVAAVPGTDVFVGCMIDGIIADKRAMLALFDSVSDAFAAAYNTSRDELVISRIGGNPETWVLTTAGEYRCGCGIAMPSVLRDIARKLQIEDGFFVIPSSVHEVLIVQSPGDNEDFVDGLKMTIRGINRNPSLVGTNEVLSNNLFWFNASSGELKTL